MTNSTTRRLHPLTAIRNGKLDSDAPRIIAAIPNEAEVGGYEYKVVEFNIPFNTNNPVFYKEFAAARAQLTPEFDYARWDESVPCTYKEDGQHHARILNVNKLVNHKAGELIRDDSFNVVYKHKVGDRKMRDGEYYLNCEGQIIPLIGELVMTNTKNGFKLSEKRAIELIGLADITSTKDGYSCEDGKYAPFIELFKQLGLFDSATKGKSEVTFL